MPNHPVLTMPFPLSEIQHRIRLAGLDGWLLADFRGTNPVALHLCGLASSGTRRWFLYIPASGAPRLLVHAIEQGTFAELAVSLGIPLDIYVGWQDLRARVGELLAEANVVAMEFSAGNDVPTLDLVGAGTIELVREVGQVGVAGSQDLVQAFQAVLTPDQVQSHRAAAAIVLETKDAAFGEAARAIEDGRPLTEYELQQFIMQKLEGEGLDRGHAPIVAVNAHAADPHFEPAEQASSPIRRGDILLIDLWGKQANLAGQLLRRRNLDRLVRRPCAASRGCHFRNGQECPRRGTRVHGPGTVERPSGPGSPGGRCLP